MDVEAIARKAAMKALEMGKASGGYDTEDARTEDEGEMCKCPKCGYSASAEEFEQ